MKRSIFITNSQIDERSGGGIVGFNIVKALQNTTKLVSIFSDSEFDRYRGIDAFCYHPRVYSYPPIDPFFMDYMVHNHIYNDAKMRSVDIAQFYADPWGLTAEWLKTVLGATIIADLAPHKIELSRDEHIKHSQNKTYPFPHLTVPALWKIYSKHLRVADIIITHSKIGANYIKKQADLTIDPDVIPHGCTIPPSIPDYPNEVIPGYFGAPGLDKGIWYLISAWNNYNSSKKMVFGGKQMQGFSIQDAMNRFDIIGFVEKLEDFYKKISVYIQASITEGFGITPLEAMAYGRPIIVTDETGMSELITDGKEGFVIPICDIKAIQDKFKYFEDNPSEVKRMGTEARKTAERYTWKEVRKQYERIYNSI